MKVPSASGSKARSFVERDTARVHKLSEQLRVTVGQLGASIRVVLALLVTLILVLACVAIWLRPSGFSESNEFVRTVAQVIGGFALLAGLYFSAESVRNSARTLDHQRESRLLDRYYEAIGQLDHESEGVRIGALYSLKSLFGESVLDRESIVEVLTAFLRTRASTRRENHENLPHDVDKALQITGGLLKSIRPEHQDELFDLKEVDLHDLFISDSSFANMDLSKADMSDGLFLRCAFRKSYLYSTNFTKTHFVGCDFKDAYMIRAVLFGSTLSSCRNLTWSYIADAEIDAETTLPEYLLKSPPKWYTDRFGDPSKRTEFDGVPF